MTAARSALDDVSFCHLVIIGVTDVTSPTAGSRRLLFTRLAREGPVQPGGCCVRPFRLPGRDASIAGRRNPLG